MALEMLLPWPGNIRELQHVVRRAALISRGTHVTSADIELKPSPADGSPGTMTAGGDETPDNIRAHVARAVKMAFASGDPNLNQTLHELLDSELLRMTLAECGGNQVQTARRLGISRNGLRAKFRALGLE